MGEESQTQDDPKIGLVLQERYRIIRRLGEGGMGAVYEGEHLLIKRRVAIKCLHPHFAQNPEVVARFHREALAATSAGHPNIVDVTDMGRFDDGTVFMVLEYLEGRDWSDELVAQGPQPLGKTVRILAQVCDALSAAHEKGIVHRDLKPENIFLLERGDNPDFAKVLDFGISKVKDAGPTKSMTRTGATMGTPYYMSPEQAQGKKSIDHRADIYSLGVVLFEALTGQHPFDDESIHMLILKICTDPAPSLLGFRPDLPPEIEAIVTRAIAKEPSERFANCDEFKAALWPFRDVDTAAVLDSVAATKDIPSGAISARRSAIETEAAQSQPMQAAPRLTDETGLQQEPARRSYALPVAALVVLLGVTSVGVMSMQSDDVVAPDVVEVTQPQVTEGTSMVQVAIRVVSEDGAELEPTLFIDNAESSYPFSGALSPEPHRVRAEAPGYEVLEERIDLSLETGERSYTFRAVALPSPTRAQRPNMRVGVAMEATAVMLPAADVEPDVVPTLAMSATSMETAQNTAMNEPETTVMVTPTMTPVTAPAMTPVTAPTVTAPTMAAPAEPTMRPDDLIRIGI